MASKIREQVLALESYLSRVKDDDISDNQDVQRLFCWDNAAINELVVTILTNDYVPPIILGEEELGDDLVQQYIVDGMQRSSALIKFRYGNYKITSSIEDSIIKYQVKMRDENGKVMRDEDDSIMWESREFDIKNKTYDMLPEELKKVFNSYQIRLAIHQGCDMATISKLVRRYNAHISMNQNQKSLTFIDRHARRVRTISNSSFFKNSTPYSEKEHKKGTYERIVCDCLMTTFHLDKWQKQAKKTASYLNENTNNSELEKIQNYADRMEKVCEDKFTDIFVNKDIAVWFAVFHKFNSLNIEDVKFAEFIHALRTDLHSKEINNFTYDLLNEESGTKDKRIVTAKIELLTALMMEYFGVVEEIQSDETTLSFVQNAVDSSINEEDIALYEEMLKDFEVEVPENSVLLGKKFEKPLVALVAYACAKEVDDVFPAWLVEFERENNTYNGIQNSYVVMKDSFDSYIEGRVA